MNKVAYEQKEKDVLKLPYSTRYQALKQEKIRLKKIEIAVPVGYQDKIKKRLQPNKCFVESIKFARDVKEAIYCIGQFQKSEFFHAWIEFKDQDYCFDGTFQAFYPKEKYYEYRGLKKLYTRSPAEITELANKYEMHGLYPEDWQKLKSLLVSSSS